MPIYVTRPFLPAKEEYIRRISNIFDRCQLTNQGPELRELEGRLKNYLGVKHFHFVTNGTIALQLALKALDVEEGEVITTPFSDVATISSILWERCKPVFVDIEADNYTIDPQKIEQAITSKTRAIMPVNVFGYACDLDALADIANKHNLKLIYDSAHAFGSVYNGHALSSYGDISVLSFHSTKLFHTIEGGGIICKSPEISAKLDLIKRFGHLGDNHICLGINAKQSEFHAAMGNALIDYMDEIIASRQDISKKYDSLLKGCVERPKKQAKLRYNYAYYPVIFESEKKLKEIFTALAKKEIYARRYFYPSLNKLPYLADASSCPIAEDISNRIACLPIYPGLRDEDIEEICKVIRDT